MPDAKRKVTVDGIPLEVEDTAAGVIDTLITQRDAARAAQEAAEAKLNEKFKIATVELKVGDMDSVKKVIGDMAAEIEALKKDVVTPEVRDAMVKDWAKLLGDVKRLAPSVATDGKTCLALRREVIGALVAKDATAKGIADAVLAGAALDAAPPELIRATFNALAAAAKSEASDAAMHAADAQVADALTGGGQGGRDDKSEPTGRDKFLSRQTQAWQQ